MRNVCVAALLLCSAGVHSQEKTVRPIKPDLVREKAAVDKGGEKEVVDTRQQQNKEFNVDKTPFKVSERLEMNAIRIEDVTEIKTFNAATALPAQPSRPSNVMVSQGEDAVSRPQKLTFIAKAKSIIESENESDPLRRVRLPGPSQYDSRIEIRALNPSVDWQRRLLLNARSVALVVKREELSQLTDSVYKLNTATTLKQRYNLCAGEAFGEQPVAGEGTAFLIGEDTVMTAGHVIAGSLTQYAIVFGFEMRNRVGDHETFIPLVNIFYPQRVVRRNDELDVLVFRLDRPTERPALKVSSKSSPDPDTEVYMLGHPSGLPLKAALNAEVSGESGPDYFYTTLDAFQGNSGSPVFDFATNEVIGILVSGETDYAWAGNCYRTTLCKQPYCKGEKAVKISKTLESER